MKVTSRGFLASTCPDPSAQSLLYWWPSITEQKRAFPTVPCVNSLTCDYEQIKLGIQCTILEVSSLKNYFNNKKNNTNVQVQEVPNSVHYNLFPSSPGFVSGSNNCYVSVFLPDLITEQLYSTDTLTNIFLRRFPMFIHVFFIYHIYSGGRMKGNPSVPIISQEWKS